MPVAAVIFVAFKGLLYAQSLQGVIDIHLHSDPDVMPRSVDALEVARLAAQRGMRAIVLKNHYFSTAPLAYLASREVKGIEVFGGIALNRSVGGVNAEAVRVMARLKGGRGRVVWMPTFDAENQVRAARESRPAVAVSRNGRLLPEVLEVLDVAAAHRMVVATGHSSAEESLLLVRAARQRGIAGVLVTHAMLAPVSMSVAQMREAASLGAYIEFVANPVIGKQKSLSLEDFARSLREVGFERSILASDLGQADNPLHPDGMQMMIGQLRRAGIPDAAIGKMVKANPARLLGLRE